jgi:hypothetical protein
MLRVGGYDAMMRTVGLAVVFALAGTTATRAGPAELWAGLRLGELIEVMAEEGRDYGTDLAEQVFDRGGGPTWTARIETLYDPGTMRNEIRPLFLDSFETVDTAPLERFVASDLGRRIVEHELDARRAFLDADVEAAATEGVAALRSGDPDRYALIGEFIAVNDLIEQNVAASLTFSYAFNRGLVDGQMEGMTEGEALADAWAQEDEARNDTEDWLYAQLSLAFAPLSDEELSRYIEMSRTEAGAALNAALFQAFEPTFSRIAQGLGEAVARSIEGHDI